MPQSVLLDAHGHCGPQQLSHQLVWNDSHGTRRQQQQQQPTRSRTCVCIPTCYYNYPNVHRRKRVLRSLRTSVDLASGWDARLPPLFWGEPPPTSDTAATEIDSSGRQWIRLPPPEFWQRQLAYQNELLNDPQQPPHRHPLELPFYRSILEHLQPHILRAVRQQLPPAGQKFIGLHARIEKDMHGHHKFRNDVRLPNLTTILNLLHERLQDTRRAINAYDDENTTTTTAQRYAQQTLLDASQYILVATGTDLLDEDLAVLQAATTPWNATLHHVQKPRHLHYLDASLVDFSLALKADVFVGFGGSSQSNNIAFLRQQHGGGGGDDAAFTTTNTWDYAQQVVPDRSRIPHVPWGQPLRVVMATTTQAAEDNGSK